MCARSIAVAYALGHRLVDGAESAVYPGADLGRLFIARSTNSSTWTDWMLGVGPNSRTHRQGHLLIRPSNNSKQRI
jgi:hypothetical protein